MSIDSVVFPLILDTVTSAPEFNTTIITLGNGSEQRIGNWLDARIVANASFGVRSVQELTTLIKFFRARKGPLRGFLYKDLIDHSVSGQSIGTGDGVTTTFQLIKEYSDSGNTDQRIIYKPISGTVQIYKGLILQTETTHYTINYSTGVVTFLTAPASSVVISWTGDFYVPMRFAEDRLPVDDMFFDLQEGRAAGELPAVPLVEVRET